MAATAGGVAVGSAVGHVAGSANHWHVLWWFLTSTCTCCTCPCTPCSCTSCTSSRAKRANWSVRLGDQTVLAVQPGSVRHHPLRRVQRGAQRMQAEEPDDSLDFQDLRIFSLLLSPI